MKTNKEVVIALAAAGAMAGLAVFLFATKKGKKTRKKWKKMGGELSERIHDIIDDAKEKLEDLKKECSKKEKEKPVPTKLAEA